MLGNSRHQRIYKKKSIDNEVITIFEIPKVISSDVGFQLMFGFEYPKKSYTSYDGFAKEISLQDLIKNRK